MNRHVKQLLLSSYETVRGKGEKSKKKELWYNNEAILPLNLNFSDSNCIAFLCFVLFFVLFRFVCFSQKSRTLK